jgi:hypothetical protein
MLNVLRLLEPVDTSQSDWWNNSVVNVRPDELSCLIDLLKNMEGNVKLRKGLKLGAGTLERTK